MNKKRISPDCLMFEVTYSIPEYPDNRKVSTVFIFHDCDISLADALLEASRTLREEYGSNFSVVMLGIKELGTGYVIEDLAEND